jgi:hypothetical protein
MHHRSIAVLAIVCIAFGGGGCASKSHRHRNYEEVLMPLQTGSVLHRRVYVPVEHEKRSKKKKKKESTKPEAEPSATPAPEEESTPPPDRFR